MEMTGTKQANNLFSDILMPYLIKVSLATGIK